MKIRVNDKVVVISGKDKGREGVVKKVYPSSNKVLVKGINMYKKHVKKSEAFPQGGIVDVERPLMVSKIMFICPNCKNKARLGYHIDANGRKKRICKKCKQVIK